MYEALAHLELSEARQNEFAAIYGDYNPFHVDPVAARRTPSGRPIVHGVHLALLCLETLASCSESVSVPAGLKVRFIKPVHVGDSIDIVADRTSETFQNLGVQIDGEMVVDLQLSLSRKFRRAESAPLALTVENLQCSDLSVEEMIGRSGSVPCAVSAEVIANAFPRASAWMGVEAIAALLCLSRLVGMECPGLHSLFSSFRLEFTSCHSSPCLQYSVEKFDKRFRLLKIHFRGLGVIGDLDAFVRNPPVPQPRILELASLVRSDEFSGTRALIVGGSRGLGELTAKILAAGGCDTVITYSMGEMMRSRSRRK
jgi:hypothetical protein